MTTTATLYDLLRAQIIAAPGTSDAMANGGYETTSNGSLASGSSTLLRDATHAFRGSYALKVTVANQISSGVRWFETDNVTRLDVSASTAYWFRCWVYADSAAVGKLFSTTIQWYTAAGAFVSQTDTNHPALSGGWNLVRVAVTSPATAARVTPFLLTTSAQGVFAVWVDKVELLTTLDADLNGGLWYVAPPEQHTTLPYGTVECRQVSSGAYGGEREEVECELLLYHRPWSRLATLEGLADRVDEALLRYVSTTSGMVLVQSRSREVLVPASPEDRDLCGMRLVYLLAVWPAWLTQYA